MDIHNGIMDIRKSIMDINTFDLSINRIMDIHNSELWISIIPIYGYP